MSVKRTDQFGYYEKRDYKNPSILKNPMRLLDTDIESINDRLLDLIQKLPAALSPPRAAQISVPDGRLISMSVTEDNKIGMITLLVHDISHKRVLAIRDWMKERLGNPDIHVSRNILTAYWARPFNSNPKIFELAHIITFLGPVMLADEFQLEEDVVFNPTYIKSIELPRKNETDNN